MRVWKTAIITFGGLGAIALLIPMCYAFAGKQTGVDIKVTVALAFTLTLAGAGFAARNHHNAKRASRAEQRVDVLTGKYEVEQAAHAAAQARCTDLERDNVRLRSELDRYAA